MIHPVMLPSVVELNPRLILPSLLFCVIVLTEGGTNEETNHENVLQKEKVDTIKIRGPYFPEFSYLYVKEMKSRLKERRKEKDVKMLKRGKLEKESNKLVYMLVKQLIQMKQVE